MKSKNLLAKSEGISLIEHSKNVAKFASSIAKNTLINKTHELIYIINITALLHDIGKSTKNFQDLLYKRKRKDKSKFRHNEIGWAFLQRFLNVDEKYLKYICDGVYWHHGISNKMNSYSCSDILNSLSEDDIEQMKSFLVSVLKEDNLLKEGRVIDKDGNAILLKETPYYYSKQKENENCYNTFIRNCVIPADRMVSELEENNCDLLNINPDEYIQDIINSVSKYEIKKGHSFEGERFNLQKEIAYKEEKTSIIKAPAGFGKTVIGLLWFLLNKRKLIWVCPRNMIAEAVYKRIIEDAETLGINISVELFLKGEVRKTTINNYNGFNADIIVTNIDNFLAPTINSSHSERLYFIHSCDVIFDEFHELISKGNALFASFVNIMQMRNRLTTSKTRLLSATPDNIDFLWNSLGQKTSIFPNEDKHYQAAHKNKYLIKAIENQEIPKNDCNLIILNSISQSQKVKHYDKKNFLIHSEFEDDAKEKKFSFLYKNYGKFSNYSCKDDVIGTHIIQASLDISLANLYESVLSPNGTGQRCGRIDRDGKRLGGTICGFISNEMSEKRVVEILYDRNLQNLWFDFFYREYNGKKIDLDEFYRIYNSFHKKHNDTIKKHATSCYKDSLKCLSSIYPIKYNKLKNDESIITAGSNKLRSSGHEIFYIVKKYRSDAYSGPFSIQVYSGDFKKEFKEEGNILNKIKKVYKHLRDNNDIRFDFNDLLNKGLKLHLEDIKTASKKSNTPYVRFDKLYHEEFGIIKENLLYEFLNNNK